MLVSVIVPAFNAGQFIDRAIRSVLDQTITNWELIVVDDGSTDHTVATVRSFSDSRIRLVSHNHNRGLATARNSGLESAQGEWIAALDADDWWAPNRLEVLLPYAKDHGLDVVGDDVWTCGIDHDGSLLWKTRLLGQQPNLFSRSITAQDVAESMVQAIQPIVRHAFLVQSGVRWRPAITYGEDFCFLMDATLAGAEVHVYSGAFYFYLKGRRGALTEDHEKTFLGMVRSTELYLLELQEGHIVLPNNLDPSRLTTALKDRRSRSLRLLTMARLFRMTIPVPAGRRVALNLYRWFRGGRGIRIV